MSKTVDFELTGYGPKMSKIFGDPAVLDLQIWTRVHVGERWLRSWNRKLVPFILDNDQADDPSGKGN